MKAETLEVKLDTAQAHAELDKLTERVEALKGELRGLRIEFAATRREADRTGEQP